MSAAGELRPVVLIGAARSGTKACRDALAIAAGVPAVPYDVGFVWRQGNESAPDDILAPALATPRIAGRVRRYLDRYADADGRVIEKTVGNTLRVPFVDAVVPDATYVHLVRDGVDVVESARRQWQAPSDKRYLLKKARHFPPHLLGSYGVKFLRNNFRRGHHGHVKSWGPRYPGIDDDVRAGDVLTVCARQWSECVNRASAELDGLHPRVIDVSYEALVREPAVTLAGILNQMPGYTTSPDRLARAAATLIVRSDGAARGRLTAAERTTLSREIDSTLERLGYEPV
ncbi:sulfotransferase [Nocardioides sp. HB32]